MLFIRFVMVSNSRKGFQRISVFIIVFGGVVHCLQLQPPEPESAVCLRGSINEPPLTFTANNLL